MATGCRICSPSSAFSILSTSSVLSVLRITNIFCILRNLNTLSALDSVCALSASGVLCYGRYWEAEIGEAGEFKAVDRKRLGVERGKLE